MATTASKATSAARKPAAKPTAVKPAALKAAAKPAPAAKPAAALKPITAPPSTAYRIVDIPEIHRDVIKRYAVPGTFVGADEKESPWVPFGPNAAIRHLAFDVRHNIFSNILWVKSKGVVGTHKHRGTVVMMCLEGSVRYLEYSWVATPGSFIYETPGLCHTLVSDHPQGVKLFGWLQGPIEFYDEHGVLAETVDVWWFMNHYESYCREHGIPLNKELYL